MTDTGRCQRRDRKRLYCRRIQDQQGPAWHLPRNVGADYLRQLTAERLVEKTNARGVPESVWHQIHKDNHLGDCEKMQLVAAYLIASQLKTIPQPPETKESAEARRAKAIRPGCSSWIGDYRNWRI